MNKKNNPSQLNKISNTLNIVEKYAKLFKRVVMLITTTILIVVVVMIIVKINHLKNNGWSFNNKTTEITISESKYSEAIAAWEIYDYINAEAYFKAALESSDEKNGTGSLESAAISQKLGALYIDMGKYKPALECLNSAYVTFKSELGNEDGNTIIALAQIAILDIKTGNTGKGFSTLNDLYDTATYYWYKIQISQMIAQCNTDLGNYKKAIEWYDVLGNLYYQFDIKNIGRVNLLNDYGVLMITVGNYSEAIQSLSSAVSSWSELGLDEDLTLANVYSNLAKSYALAGQNEESTESIKKSLEINKKLFGEHNIQTAMSYAALSYSYGASNNKDLQKEYLDNALSIAIDTVGENHMCTASIYLDLGDYYRSEKNIDKAIECHKKALEIQKNILGLNSVNTISIYEALGDDYRDNRQYALGIENANYAMEISESLLGRENLYSAHSYITAAWLYSDSGDFEKAIQLATMATEICDRQKDDAMVVRPNAYQTSGYVYLNNHDYDNSIKYLVKAKTLYEEGQDIGGKNTCNTLIFLGEAYLLKEDYSNSFISLYEAQRIVDSSSILEDEKKIIESRLKELHSLQSPELDYEVWLNEKIKNMSVNK